MGLAGFGHWWVRELAAAMPARLAAALERRRARPVLAFDGNTATLWRPAPAPGGRVQMSEVARIALDGDAQSVVGAGRAALAPLVRAAKGAAPPILVTIAPRATLRKTLTLPMALEDHLHQSLAYDLDRHTPFKPEELYFDAVVVDRDTVHNTLRVDLAAARRVLVDTVLRHAESFGARVAGVTTDPPQLASSSRINLFPEDRRPAASTWTRWQVVLPGVLLAAGALAALVLPIWQQRQQAIALNELSDQARSRATASDALRSELERRVGDYNFALDRKYAFPSVVQVLDDVTRILPDDTWITQFELHTLRGKDAQRELTLRGESANAGRLVSLLEDSKLFTQAAPRSPTTKIQPGPGEIFDVSAHLKPSTPPPSLPLDMTPVPSRPQVPAPAPQVAPAPRTAAPSSGATPSTPATARQGGPAAAAAGANASRPVAPTAGRAAVAAPAAPNANESVAPAPSNGAVGTPNPAPESGEQFGPRPEEGG